MKKFKIIAAIIAIILPIFSFSMIPSSTHAVASVCSQSEVSEEVKKANGCNGETTGLKDLIVGIVNAVIGMISIVAVIFIIVGGVQYMTSAGNPANIQKAKSTILYAVIGLVIAALSFAIVNFVITNILSENSGNSSSDSSETTDDDTTINGGGATIKGGGTT